MRLATWVSRWQGFERIELAPGESRHVQFEVPANRQAHWSEEIGGFRVDAGRFPLSVGRSSVSTFRTALRWNSSAP